MKFISELLESRATRNSQNIKKYTRYDCVERSYLILMAIEIMRHSRKFHKMAAQYAKGSLATQYNMYSSNRTDLYNFIYFANGPDGAQENLADAEYAIAQKQAKPFPVEKVKKYLQQVAKSEKPDFPTRLFMEVEKSGKISDNTYLAIRRIVTDWHGQTATSRRTAATKLLFAFRAKLPDSDMIILLQDWSSETDAEIAGIRNTERTDDPAAYISNYRFLVGADNVLQTKLFLQMAKGGKSIPNEYVQAYMPVINMIDDLAQQGPGAMQHLLLLHKRLKK